MSSTVEFSGSIPVPTISASKTIRLRTRIPLPEVLLASSFLLAVSVIGLCFGLPISLPASKSLAFTGVGNLVPMLVVVAGLLFTLLTQRAGRTLYFATALVAYGAILVMHFNIKLWVHVINPSLWDEPFWQIDEILRPLVAGTILIRNGLSAVIGPIDWLYLFAFLAMFVCSIIVHSSRSFLVFRKMILTAMLVHVLGGFSYLIAPALGPFIYEPGVNVLETQRQIFMLAAHDAALHGSISWFRTEGSEFLATGLAAMPSLHVASSAVFVYFAWKHERHLCWFYLPLFGFILIEAVATRWHYVVDIIAGLGLTGLAIFIVDWSFRRWMPPIAGKNHPVR
jgi:disulfide bond formation protein DsbB